MGRDLVRPQHAHRVVSWDDESSQSRPFFLFATFDSPLLGVGHGYLSEGTDVG